VLFRSVRAEIDPVRLADYGLAVVFAHAVGRQDLWDSAVKELKMDEPKIVVEWKTQAERKGEIKGHAESLVHVVQRRYKMLPEEVASAIRASTDLKQLDGWLDAALSKDTLDLFRQETGL